MTRQRGRWLVVALTFPGLAACAAGGAARPASVVAAVARYGDESKTRRGRPSSPGCGSSLRARAAVHDPRRLVAPPRNGTGERVDHRGRTTRPPGSASLVSATGRVAASTVVEPGRPRSQLPTDQTRDTV